MKIKINFLRLLLLINVYFPSLIPSDLSYEKLLSDYRSSEEYLAIGGLFTVAVPMASLVLLTAPKTAFSEYTEKIKPETKKLIGKVTCSLAVIANSLLTVYGLTQYNVQHNKTILVSMIFGHAVALKGIYNFAVLGALEMTEQEDENKKKDKEEKSGSFIFSGLTWMVCGFIAYNSFGLNLFRFLNENFLRHQLAKLSKKQ